MKEENRQIWGSDRSCVLLLHANFSAKGIQKNEKMRLWDVQHVRTSFLEILILWTEISAIREERLQISVINFAATDIKTNEKTSRWDFKIVYTWILPFSNWAILDRDIRCQAGNLQTSGSSWSYIFLLRANWTAKWISKNENTSRLVFEVIYT